MPCRCTTAKQTPCTRLALHFKQPPTPVGMPRAALALCLALALALPCLARAGEDAAWTNWAVQTQGHRRSLMTAAAEGPSGSPCTVPKPTTCSYLPTNFSLYIQPSCAQPTARCLGLSAVLLHVAQLALLLLAAWLPAHGRV